MEKPNESVEGSGNTAPTDSIDDAAKLAVRGFLAIRRELQGKVPDHELNSLAAAMVPVLAH